MTRAAILALIAIASPPAPRAEHSCVVIYDEAAGSEWASDAASCATRLPPASTFKIPHALVALETGVITTSTIEKWDGTPHPEQPKWDRDHTVLSAMKPSVLWLFQRIAPRIGAERMHGWLERLHYGNADTSGEITRYWINGTLRVTPIEQLAFLRQFYARTLPVRLEYQDAIKDALRQQPGTQENGRGVHKLSGAWPKDAVLFSKTGATTTDRESVSWLVGALERGGKRFVFASAVWRDEPGVDQLAATQLALVSLRSRGALQ